MMKRKISILLLVAFAFSILSAEVIYKSEEEYKQLKKSERLAYWNDLETELADLQKAKADAIIATEKVNQEIQELKTKLTETNNEYVKIYNEVLTSLNVDKGNLSAVKQQLKMFNAKIASWKTLSDDDLWKANKSIKEFVEEYNSYKVTDAAKAPDFRRDFSDLQRKILALQNDVESVKPRYIEDEYTVKRGDSLAKISGYEYIYNDPSKWGIIYRANRDEIRDPNIISVDHIVAKNLSC